MEMTNKNTNGMTQLSNKEIEQNSSYDKDILKVKAYLEMAESCNLLPEVITTALHSVVNTTELYKNDIASALRDALREWDCI